MHRTVPAAVTAYFRIMDDSAHFEDTAIGVASQPVRTAQAGVRIPLRVLIVEDSEDSAAIVVKLLQRGGYDVTHERVDNADAMRAALQGGTWDIVISDHRMPEFDAFGALEVRRRCAPDLPFIIVSGVIGEEAAVNAMQAGACDFVMKGNLARLRVHC